MLILYLVFRRSDSTPREPFIDVGLHGKIFFWAQLGKYSFKEFNYNVFLNFFTIIFSLRATFVISLPIFETQFMPLMTIHVKFIIMK